MENILYKTKCPRCSKEKLYIKKYCYERAVQQGSKCSYCRNYENILANPQRYKKMIETSYNWKVKNKEKVKIHLTQWRKDNVGHEKNWRLKHTHGITLVDYNNLFLKQQGKCKICQKHQSEFKVPLNVDHCHKTNVIRGLLCTKCNTALGSLEDNPVYLQNAIDYLKPYNLV
jgi:hypothetical protein